MLRSAAGVGAAAVIAAATVVVATAGTAAVVAVAPTATAAAGEENNQDNDNPEATIVSAHIFEPFLRTRQYFNHFVAYAVRWSMYATAIFCFGLMIHPRFFIARRSSICTILCDFQEGCYILFL